MGLIKWFKSCLSEPNGNGSSTRVILAAIIAFVLGVGISFAVSTNHGKFSMDQFCTYLQSAGTFVLTTGGPLYGMNKIANVMNNKNSTNNGEGNPPGA